MTNPNIRIRTPEQTGRYNANRRKKYAVNKEKRKAWRAANKEKLAAYQRNWLERNPTKRKEWNEANKDKVIGYRLKKRYGITLEERDAMFAAQDHKCAICGRPGELHIDHCHVTGAVRGGLCDDCNNGLGRFFDCIENLTAAINYLRKHRTD